MKKIISMNNIFMKPLKMRTQLLLLGLVIIIPLAGLNLWNLKSQLDSQIHYYSKLVDSFSTIFASVNAEYLSSRRNILARFAEREKIKQMNPDDCDPAILNFRDFDPNFSNIIVINLDGDVVCSAIPIKKDISFKEAENFKRILEEKSLVIGYPVYGKISNKWILPLNYPVVDSSGNIIGSIGAPIDLQKYSPINPYYQLPFQASVYIVDIEKNIISTNHNNDKLIGTALSDHIGIPEEVLNELPDVPESGKLNLLIGKKQISNTSWEIWITISTDEFMHEIYSNAKFDLMIFIVIVLLIILLDLIFIRRLEDPIKDIADTAVLVANGDINTRMVPKGPIEIQNLVQQFNTMLEEREKADKVRDEYSLTLKNKENELLQSRQRLLAVLNTVGDAIITIDKHGAIVMVNKAFESIWGYEQSAVIGKQMTMLMPEKYQQLHVEGMSKYLETGKQNVLNRDIEIEAINATGTIFPIELHIAETNINNEIYFTGAVKDITERKKTENELIESKKNIAEKLKLMTMDLQIKIKELNCLYGFSELVSDDNANSNFVLKESLDLIRNAFDQPELVSCAISLDNLRHQTPNYKMTENTIRRPIGSNDIEGGYIKVSAPSEYQYRDHEIQIVDVMASRIRRYFERIHSRRELDSANQILQETQLQLIQAAKLDTIGTLAAGVAHEVKNPLAVIQLGIDYLKRKSEGNTTISDVIDEIDDALYRADMVIKQLVDFSASNELSLEQININHLIDSSIKLVRHQIVSMNINILKDYSDSLPTIIADKNKLSQVFINVFMNAIQAMEESNLRNINITTKRYQRSEYDPDETLSLFLGDNLLEISIEDTGKGINDGDIENIFEPFFTTKESGKGTGLGLTVSQNIIRLHGGKIQYKNTDKGTKVRILLKIGEQND